MSESQEDWTERKEETMTQQKSGVERVGGSIGALVVLAATLIFFAFVFALVAHVVVDAAEVGWSVGGDFIN